MKTRNTPGLFLRTAVALALAAGVGAAHADATLDKIKAVSYTHLTLPTKA